MRADRLFTSLGGLENFRDHFRLDLPPWLWVDEIAKLFSEKWPLRLDGFVRIAPGVHAHGTATIAPTAIFLGPALIGENCEIRHGALIRGNVLLGAHCVVGNSCEIKNSLLLDGAQVPHFNYVGDSILGAGSHLGAGAVIANLRLDRQPVKLHMPEGTIPTGKRKFGALLGDGAQVGCNGVLQPGSILEPGAIVLPCTARGGYIPVSKSEFSGYAHQ
ncbi:MAG: UDP-N-acetylglucosamine diphosphorylase [Puniceicoccales bacterium]|jgi:NDP-sugar pyrophosphorylase family protein|nr:UDP-N-acetylglucosamine diphosphorylase [Puniceicoccales bacterium]